MNRALILLSGVSGLSSLLLIDSAIKGAVLLLFAAGVVLLLRRDSAATRHMVWLVAIVAMLAVPLLSALLPEWRVLPEWAAVTNVQDVGARQIDDVLYQELDAIDLHTAANVVQTDELSVEAEGQPTGLPALEQDAPPTLNTSSAASLPVIVAETTGENQPAISNWKTAAFATWLIGFSVLSLRLIAARLLLWQIEHVAIDLSAGASKRQRKAELSAGSAFQSLSSERINVAFIDARRALNIRQSVKLLVHPDKTVPVVWGILRPRLVLPVPAMDWPEQQLQSVLLHELAHIKRRDTLGQLLAQFACVMHWFNPLVWFAGWRLHVERERACDDLVLASGVRASDYAAHLLDVATKLTTTRWTQTCGLAMARNSSLHGRLSAVLSKKQNRRSVTTALLITSVVLTVGIAIPLAMLHAADDQTETSAVSKSIKKEPLKPWAYRGVDSALLRRWQQLEGEGELIPETRVAALRSAIGRFVASVDESTFTLSAKDIATLKVLQVRGQEKKQHTAAEAGALISDIFAVHGEPIQMAFNEAPWPGTPIKGADREQLAFGPPAANGLRVALYCPRKEVVFADTARLDLKLWNTGTKTIVAGIGRDTPGLYPKLQLRAVGRDGRKLSIVSGPESQMLADTKFTKTWQLRPGESVDVYGYRLRVGTGTPREHEHWPDWYSVVELPDAQSGEVITLTAALPYPHAPGKPPVAEVMQSGSVTIQATAPKDVAVWSPSRVGTWPMPDGVTMNLTQKVFHGADVATSMVITWPEDSTGTTYSHQIQVAAGAFANQQSWDVAWERNSTSLWIITSDLRSWKERGPATATQVRRVNFSDRTKITTTTWYHQPKSMPESIRAEFLKSFQPMRIEPRRTGEADGSVQIDEAHDVRPIGELLSGDWQNQGGDIDVRLEVESNDVGKINWTLGFKDEGRVSVVSAKLSRITFPNNAIGLSAILDFSKSVRTDGIVGKLRRGPNNTLLLDITPTRKYPEYTAAKGIVLVRAPVPRADIENSPEDPVAQNSDNLENPQALAMRNPTTLPPHLEALLDWGDTVDGLRGAMMIQTAAQKPDFGTRPRVFLVLQNVSNSPIRFCDTQMKKNDDVRIKEDKRTLYLRDTKGILSGLSGSGGTGTDVELQPREVVMIDQFYGEQPNRKGQTASAAIVDVIIHNPSLSYSSLLNLVSAPQGAWTGKLTTPSSRGALSAMGPLPKNEQAQRFFRYCLDHARLNGDIPGGTINLLRDKVLYFIDINTGDQYGDADAKEMQPIVARFEKTGDWSQADTATLLDDIAEVTTIPFTTTMDAIRNSRLQRGRPLPTLLEDANWGDTLAGGLRMAWILDPTANQHHSGVSLKSRVVIHNSGNEPVAFVTRSFHQPGHSAKNPEGSAIPLESTFWTTIGRPEAYRLHPGEYCEVYAPGIGIGPRASQENDWANARPGTQILANEGDEVVFQPGNVWLTGDHNQKVDSEWWLKFVSERLDREAPLPASRKERKLILFRVVQDLFGTAPRTTEADSFYADQSPEALMNLAVLLSKRSWITAVTGAIKSGPAKFKVLPIDPSAATRARIASNPGRYNLDTELRLVVSRRTNGRSTINEANLTWYPKGKESIATPVSLPSGYNTWAAGWLPGTSVLWVATKIGLRSYDFSNPESIQMQQFDGEEQASASIADELRTRLMDIVATGEQPKGPVGLEAVSARSDSTKD